MNDQSIRAGRAAGSDETGPTRRFYVRAGSINAVRRALHRAPGGAKVVGRYDRETIECQHTMNSLSYGRHWPVIHSRLEKCGLRVVAAPLPIIEGDGGEERPGHHDAGSDGR
ncbi:hypothetical protein [Aquisphaera giovannonii]|nr:hypothetical protein [Aquisphaera giovannonii]